jgi:2-polyprenyl-3-methyl-5-hydroxy-6-metoxy-1,4-benzoquinol methylase
MNGKYDVDLEKVALSWEMASETTERRTGAMNTYSSLELNGRIFPGDRPFELRWDIITSQFDFAGKRVLDCGCYLGLFSTFLKLHFQAHCTAFDREPKICEAATLFASAFNLPITIYNVDLNSSHNWELVLAGDYDVALVLNIWKYCRDKRRFVALLSRIPNLILEGEVSQETEMVEHLARHDFTRRDALGLSERNRTIFLLRKA